MVMPPFAVFVAPLGGEADASILSGRGTALDVESLDTMRETVGSNLYN